MGREGGEGRGRGMGRGGAWGGGGGGGGWRGRGGGGGGGAGGGGETQKRLSINQGGQPEDNNKLHEQVKQKLTRAATLAHSFRDTIQGMRAKHSTSDKQEADTEGRQPHGKSPGRA